MPIYEYRCSSCGRKFERLVQGRERVRCPSCGSSSLKRLFSVFAVKSGDRFKSSVSGSCEGCASPSCASCKL